MKIRAKNPFLPAAVIAGIGLLLTGRMTAQTFTTLHNLAPIASNNFSFSFNSDGCYPAGGLILSGKTLYGTAGQGGLGGTGTIFAVNTDGSGFTNLHNFAVASTVLNPFMLSYVNSDGGGPGGRLVWSGNTLYGVAGNGGSSGYGALFGINTDGSGFTNLHFFTSGEGHPGGGLVLSGHTLYGVAGGGDSDKGMVFAIYTDGTGFTNLHNFTGTNDGAYPTAPLLLSGGTLYGTASGGGSSNSGTVFALNTGGSGFTNLYNFTGGNDNHGPVSALILSGSTLYGTASGGPGSIYPAGGPTGAGTAFALNTDGTGFTNLYYFYGGVEGSSGPFAALILSGTTLLGTAPGGGVEGGIASDNGEFGDGAIFALDTGGTSFTNLHRFPANQGEGNGNVSELILSHGTLYGTTVLCGNSGVSNGQSTGVGSVFSISFAPQLAIACSGSNVVLSWPTNVSVMDTSGFVLQSATNPFSPASWSTVSPLPVVLNGLYTVTNPIAGGEMFYRLSQ